MFTALPLFPHEHFCLPLIFSSTSSRLLFSLIHQHHLQLTFFLHFYNIPSLILQSLLSRNLLPTSSCSKFSHLSSDNPSKNNISFHPSISFTETSSLLLPPSSAEKVHISLGIAEVQPETCLAADSRCSPASHGKMKPRRLEDFDLCFAELPEQCVGECGVCSHTHSAAFTSAQMLPPVTQKKRKRMRQSDG